MIKKTATDINLIPKYQSIWHSCTLSGMKNKLLPVYSVSPCHKFGKWCKSTQLIRPIFWKTQHCFSNKTICIIIDNIQDTQKPCILLSKEGKLKYKYVIVDVGLYINITINISTTMGWWSTPGSCSIQTILYWQFFTDNSCHTSRAYYIWPFVMYLLLCIYHSFF